MNKGALSLGILFCFITITPILVPVPHAQQVPPPLRFAFGGNAAEIPAEFLENVVFLPVRVNNSQPSLFVLDSTATASSIDPARAGELSLADLRDPALQLPGVQFSLATLLTSPRENFAAQTGRPYQGTVGTDFLGSVVLEIDYGRQTVRAYDPRFFQYSGPGTRFPLSFEGGKPLIRAKLELPGQKAREGGFVVNSALHASIHISEGFAETHHLFSAHMKTVQRSDPQIKSGDSIALGRVREIQFGAYRVESAIVEISPNALTGESGKNVTGTIGAGILRRFTVIFDLPHQQMILAPNFQFPEYEEEDKSGITLIAKGPGLKRFEVIAVQPSTPASEAGIQKGDIIAGVDEEPAADLTLVSVRSLFRQVGHRYKLTIERNGQTSQVSIEMRRLL